MASVRLGMFVAELDRPWLDTRFGVQGFLVSSPRQIEVLREQCQTVTIDADRSDAEMAHAVPLIGTPVSRPPGSDGSGDAFHGKVTAPVSASLQVAAAALPLAQGSADKAGLLHWFRSTLGRTKRAEEPSKTSSMPRELQAELEAALPRGTGLRDWPEIHPVDRELPRARAALAQSEEVLAKVFADLASGRPAHIEAVQEAMDHVVASMVDNPNALLWVSHLREHSQRTYRHALRVALYVVALGRQLGFPRDQLVRIGVVGLLSDIGNARVPQQILDKPGLLTPEEFEIVKRHVKHGLEMLSEGQDVPPEVLAGIAQHHERMDGSGYPAGLAGRQISVYGRMAAIADCFAALTARRGYASVQTSHQALMSLFQWSPKLFHAPLVEQFVQAIGLFPVGSMVELSSGEVAVVLAHNRVRRLEPRVLVLTDSEKRRLPRAVERDLHDGSAQGATPSVHILRGLPAGVHGLSPTEYYGNVAADAGLAA